MDSIYIGMTALQGFSQGIKVIANNTANMDTPGYKSSSLQFADLFYSTSRSGGGLMQVGYGLDTTGTTLNFKQGELRQTGNTLDLAVDGEGLFTLRDDAGLLHYTRAGQFMFDTDGVLVNRADGSKVMGVDAKGTLGEITIAGRSTTGGKATSTVTFSGNLSSTATTQTLEGIKVMDDLGGEHVLTATLTASTTDPGHWTVALLDGATTVGTGEIAFSDGRPDASHAKVSITYTPAGLKAIPLTLDFSQDVTSFASGTLSTLAFKSQDGYAPGALTGVSFDDTGTLVMSYSNGQTEKGVRLSLGRFDSPAAVKSAGGNQFDATDGLAWHIGVASQAGFGRVRSGVVEMSNVDLSQELGDLVIKQRGYQGASQMISTADQLLQELFTMKGK